MAGLPPKVAFRREHTGDVAMDRLQQLAQSTLTAHEQTKGVVSALINKVYVALAVDTSLNAAAYATLLTANIITVLKSGYLDITFSASGVHNTNAGTVFFQILVDGVVVKGCYTTVPISFSFNSFMVVRVPVKQGAHVVLLQTKTNTNVLVIAAKSTNEDHAHLLVGEAA